ncbi:MAG: citrate synthase [Candidatus Neomarinimicrobiota bacterium]
MSQAMLQTICKKMQTACQIDPRLYEKYNVKRGLRNEDHTGVLVGLTSIGDVVGYRSEAGRVVPIEGQLLYRGYQLDQLVKGFQSENRHGFEEICYLLLAGELPNHSELKVFSEYLAEKRDLPENFTNQMLLNLVGTDMMNMLARAVLVLYTNDPRPEDRSEENIVRQSLDLIAKFPTIVAYSFNAYRHAFKRKTLSIRHPRQELSMAENFLYMLKGERYSKLEADMLDLALVTHAEHGGGNNSTFTLRVTSSAGTDTYSAIAAAIGSLKGPYHGGANLKVLEMMNDIKKNLKNWDDKGAAADYLLKILKKEVGDQTGKIYGIGHAVYTLSDPRVKILKTKAAELAAEKNRLEEFHLYNLVEELAPQVFADFKGRERSKIVCANVDFYSGFVYSCIAITPELYTPIFAIGRLAGWCAHRLEELNHRSRRIIRPAYKNVTPERQYVDILVRG